MRLHALTATCVFAVFTEITDGTRTWVVFVNQERIATGCRATSVRNLHGKCTGVEAEGEDIVLAAVPRDNAWQVASEGPDLDAKTLLSLQLAGLGRYLQKSCAVDQAAQPPQRINMIQ